jgi:hypothetical protein
MGQSEKVGLDHLSIDVEALAIYRSNRESINSQTPILERKTSADIAAVIDTSSSNGTGTTLQADNHVTEPSTNGFKAKLTVFGAFIALFCTFGQMSAFGTFQTWYAAHQLRELHPSTIAWIGSIQLWTFFFSVRSFYSESEFRHFDSNLTFDLLFRVA